MAISEEWPSGKRHAHHSFDAHDSRRRQALVWRDHHTEDAHTHDGDYAAIDEALIRIAALETPTNESRLNRHRKLKLAREIRRQYNREANWLVTKGEHQPYQRHVRLNAMYPDQYVHPGTDGLSLRDEDVARIGPVKSHIDSECDARIDDLRPRLSELLAFREGNKAAFPGESDHVTLLITNRINVIERERGRARFLKALNLVAEDYYEPHHWTTAKSDELLEHVRLSELGTPKENDPWHSLASSAMSSTSQHDDLFAVCGAVRDARNNESVYPIWSDPPDDLPVVSVTVNTYQVTISWSGSLPANVSVRATLVVSANLKAASPINLNVVPPRTLNLAGDRIAVLTQFERAASAEVTAARTVGTIGYVGSLS